MKTPKELTDDELLQEMCDHVRIARNFPADYDRKRSQQIIDEVKERGLLE